MINNYHFSIKTFILLILALLPLLGASDTQPADTRQGKDYAIFFYVTDYDDRRWTALPDTETETEKTAGELENNYGFDCEIVRNPSKEQIRE